MPETTIPEPAWIREAARTDRLARLLARAVENADVAASDVFSLGDWIEPLDECAADNLGLLLTSLFLADGEGSLAVNLDADALTRRLDGIADDPDLQGWIADALDDERSGRFEHVIGDGRHRGVDRRPVLTWTDGTRRFLYFQKHLRAEEILAKRLSERAARPGRFVDDAAVVAALDDVLKHTPLKARGEPVRWDADQLTALGLAIARPLVVISGGPGTGKTTVVLALLRTLARLGIRPDRIALAAPTGRASQRLGDSLRTGLESLGDAAPEVDRSLMTLTPTTLHSLLDYHPGRDIYRRHVENPIPADVVVIDEVSMVGVEQLAALLKALPDQSQLILLGDKDQLPSVEAGAALGQLMPAEVVFSGELRTRVGKWLSGASLPTSTSIQSPWLSDAVVILRTNHRSEKGIRAAAEAINRQDDWLADSLVRFGGDFDVAENGCWFWPQIDATPSEVRSQIIAWAKHVYETPLDGASKTNATLLDAVRSRNLPDGELADRDTIAWLTLVFRGLDRARLLTLVKQGPWGCEPINQELLLWLRRKTLGKGRSHRSWTDHPVGTPILVTQNDRIRGLFNGDVGLTLRGADGSPRVVFARRGGFAAFAPGTLPDHDLGFALTVHKSQGSEFERALVILPPTGARRLLTKELLYTAITRAKSLAIISATDESLRSAINRRIERDSGIMRGSY